MSAHEPLRRRVRPTNGKPLTHRSLFVRGELHLGAVGDCRKCGPYSRETEAEQSSPEKVEP